MWLHCLVYDVLQGLCPKRSGAGCGCTVWFMMFCRGCVPRDQVPGVAATVWFMMFCRGCVPRDQAPGVAATVWFLTVPIYNQVIVCMS